VKLRRTRVTTTRQRRTGTCSREPTNALSRCARTPTPNLSRPSRGPTAPWRTSARAQTLADLQFQCGR